MFGLFNVVVKWFKFVLIDIIIFVLVIFCVSFVSINLGKIIILVEIFVSCFVLVFFLVFF